MNYSARRTDRFSRVRYVLATSLDPVIAEHAERVTPDYVAVWIDPRELSFDTYENILPLDRLFAPMDLALTYEKDLASDVHQLRLHAWPGPDLDALPFYEEPHDRSARGGQRYIFHAAELATALTRAIRAELPIENIAHVNPVVRMNRFEPGDTRFHQHTDTPYFDRARGEVSLYTILIYLTGGTGPAVFELGATKLDRIDPLTCIVMHQRHAHAGGPFTDGRKAFLRTELIMKNVTVAHDARIAKQFAVATYLTGETPIADAAYNRAAAAHFHGPEDPVAVAMTKTWRGITWRADGYDYLVPRSVSLVDATTIALLDYFNCTIDGEAFRRTAFATVDKDALFPPCELALTCCPTHRHQTFDPTLSHEVQDIYRTAQASARDRVDPAPIMFLGTEILVDETKFVIEPGLIHVLSRARPEPVNFAACWQTNHSPGDYVATEATYTALNPLVPPILWHACGDDWHLQLDFFRNDWMVVAPEREDARVPWIENDTADEVEGRTWRVR
ncbi:MAG: hypothetical protein QM831_42825 [Kofleriaceae bacterium]